MPRSLLSLLVVGLVSALLVPAGSSSADEPAPTRLSLEGGGGQCLDPGDPLLLQSARVRVGKHPSPGRSVTWHVPAAGTDLEKDVILGPVLTDVDGHAAAPPSDVRILDRAQVKVRVAASDDAASAIDFMLLNVVGQELSIGHLSVSGPQDYSRRLYLHGSSITSLVRAEDGTCHYGRDPRTQIVVEGVVADGSMRTLDRRPVPGSGLWSTSVFPPTVGRATLRVRAELPGGRTSSVHEVSVEVPRDEPYLGVKVDGALAYDHGDYFRIERGSSPSMQVFLDQQYWRPIGGEEPARSVEVRFRQASTGKVTRLADLQLVRDRYRRVDVLRRPMRTAGTYELTYRGNAFDEPATMSFGVRFKPRITGFAPRTTEGRAYRPVYRTVTVRDGVGAFAQLEHRTRDGWVGSGRSQRIPADGTVRLGSRNDTRKDRTHRVVVHVSHRDGARVRIATTPASWKVRNR